MDRKFILNFYENMLKDLTKKKGKTAGLLNQIFFHLQIEWKQTVADISADMWETPKNNIYCTACFSPGYGHIINANVVISDIS